MASPADSPESPHTLPRPELNPLLNPLLGDNMGRWAEVYFTSAPEKREEAVVELLRELEAQNASASASPVQLSSTPEERLEARKPVPENPPLQAHPDNLRACHTCGHTNPVTHQFCGMCGAQLSGADLKDARGQEGQNLDRPHFEQAKAPAYQEFADDYREPIEERPDLYDLSPFHSLREAEYADEVDYGESPSVRYRYYIAALVAIVIMALGYTAWRASRTEENTQQAQLAPPPAATDAAPAHPTANTGPASSTSTTSAKANTQPGNSAANHAAAPSTQKPVDAPKRADVATIDRPIPATSSSASPSPTAGNSELQGTGNGAEELVVAQHFLSGSNGQGRDSAEAAKWLWKSIAKHNGPAVLVLAELYLKGDGVAKNCDQARVLLDSAARRGTAGAGEKLRNLRAFGCQ